MEVRLRAFAGGSRFVLVLGMLLLASVSFDVDAGRQRAMCEDLICGGWPEATCPADPADRTESCFIDCGRHGELVCETGLQCDAGFTTWTQGFPQTIVCPTILCADEQINGFCYDCGGHGELGCIGPCNNGLVESNTSNLSGPITACSSFLPGDPEPREGLTFPTIAQMLDGRGICSDAAPESLAGSSREPWADSAPPSPARGTVLMIHGRGGSCGGGPGAGLSDRNQLLYCAQYNQPAEPLMVSIFALDCFFLFFILAIVEHTATGHDFIKIYSKDS